MVIATADHEELVYQRPEALSDIHTHYCPGCTHGTAHRIVAEVIDELGIQERTILVASVGCSVFAYNYFDVDSCEAAHGRAPAMATGIKRIHPDKIVFTYQGDGDLASIGMAEVIHAAGRGENITTIFINNAHNFGLSDLHQMRGRVGRGNKKAFCYFITPPYEAMTPEARKRIQALEQFTDLGSGFHIAMKDLEIRGAGDLLGGEQSGFINEIGFETYQKILAEAIEELKDNEFKDLYHEERQARTSFVRETQIDTDFELLFPDDYVNNITERLNLYTEMNECSTEAELEKFREQLRDRFGPLPQEASDLLDSVRIKWLATSLGLEKVVMKKGKLVGYFIADQESDFYQSPAFTRILQRVQQHPGEAALREKQTRSGLRLLLVVEKVSSPARALSALHRLAELPAAEASRQG